MFIGDQSLPRACAGGGPSPRRSPTPPTSRSGFPARGRRTAASGRAGDDLAAFVNRTVTGAYATAAELEAATTRRHDSAARYPGTSCDRYLDLVARSIKSGSPARVYYVIQSGYDSHAAQLPTQASLLGEFARSVRAFLDDLAAAKLADGVLLLAFSEFGRRPQENGSLGTDHGTAGPVFLAGPNVKAGLVGKTPSLGDLENGDLKWSIDFRSVYATLLDQWLGVPAEEVLGQRFEHLPILES